LIAQTNLKSNSCSYLGIDQCPRYLFKKHCCGIVLLMEIFRHTALLNWSEQFGAREREKGPIAPAQIYEAAQNICQLTRNVSDKFTYIVCSLAKTNQNSLFCVVVGRMPVSLCCVL
jgi:hypothetical protein